MTSGDLFADEQSQAKKALAGPVTCLGMTFENDEARRTYFTEELRKKLQDPEFRKIEGFPLGDDEDILNLSDPPYYTACPNPWVAKFITQWEAEKPEQPEGWSYHREPFAADVSEGKNHPIYNAHSYHTKVPHRAIMRYILHYTQPGDIVFDGFCGTGMTGVAAQMCGDREEVLALGFQVQQDGTVLQQETDENGKEVWSPFSKLGARKVVLKDLSPAATFISYNYNIPTDTLVFKNEANKIIEAVEAEYGWMYETLHSDGKTVGKINYTVWSDVYLCPQCTEEVIFWDVAVDRELGKIIDSFSCPSCNSHLTKKLMERALSTKFDKSISKIVKQVKQVPVTINYSLNGKRFNKVPDKFDFDLLDKIEAYTSDCWFPDSRMIKGKETRRNDPVGLTHVHHFFYSRTLIALSAFSDKSRKDNERALWVATAVTEGSSKLNRERPFGLPSKLSGTLYVSSMIREINIIEFIKRKILRYQNKGYGQSAVIGTSSSTTTQIESNSLDYIFIDPPFGANLNYSELNFIWESWLQVITENSNEAIVNSSQNKGSLEYRSLMTKCFREAYRILKSGHWMTVEFSNTKAAVWNSIQTALTDAGFIVANVSALDKKQGSFKAVTTPTAVRQDLVISVYKPSDGFEERFENEGQSKKGVWEFIRTHLEYLPVIKMQEGVLQVVPERDPRILFDQMIAYYVRKGFSVPVSSQEFQIGLAQQFIERDGMYFLPEQAAEYDRRKMLSGEVQQASLFVSDEASAIDWLRQILKIKPQAFSDLNPLFMQQLGGWNKNEAQLDLSELLNQNFLSYDGKGPVPEQIHAYLSSNWKEMRNLAKDEPALIAKAKDRWYVADPRKAGDLEKLRERALLKEFGEYKGSKNKFKRSDKFRLEAIRAGFKKAWQERDYAVIIAVADKLPISVLEEDPKLLMWYDQAVTRVDAVE